MQQIRQEYVRSEDMHEIRRIPTKADFQREMKDARSRLIVINFTAEWCSRHESVTPQIQKFILDPEFSEVIFLELDVDDNEETAAMCDIDFPPTVQFYRYGKMVAQLRSEDLDNFKFVLQLHR